MNEQKKDECCSPSGSCCGGAKKLIVGIILGLVIFTCGYLMGKGGLCSMGSSQKTMCPITQK
jgi:hypothetical protein